MKRILYISAALMTLFSWISCERISSEDNQVKLYASMKRVPTKGTALDNSGIRDYDYGESLDIALVRIDQNLSAGYPYFKNTGSPIMATMSGPDASLKRDIEFSTAQYFRNETDNIRYASWYPANVGDSYTTDADKSTVSFDIDGATDILYGSVAEGNKTDGFNDIVFNHALCQFNIYAYKMDLGTDDDDWGKLKRIIIKNIQKKLLLTLPNSSSDEYSFKFPDEIDSDLFDLDLSDEGNGILWAPGDEIPFGFDNKVRVATYLAPPPANGYITMGITTQANTPYQQISIARNFQKGCAYDIVLRFTSHGIINAEISVGKWNYYSLNGGEKIEHDVQADMYYDLSAYSTANCYIVPSGNYGYSFDGTVKGKSSIPLDKTPGYIDILWSDNTNIWDRSKAEDQNYLQLVSHSLSKERIMFKVGNIKDDNDKTLRHKGNVVIAAYDNATDKNILWTWHIWLNDGVGSIGYTNGYLVQSHNLGASAPEDAGLYYQWGRKDPFALGHITPSDETATIARTVSNPTVFYGRGHETWYSGTIDQLREETFGASDLEKRSVYDPCPSGYFVPDSRMWSKEAIGSYQKTYNPGSYVELTIQEESVKFPLSGGYLDDAGVKQTASVPLFLWSTSLNKGVDAIYTFQYPQTKESVTVTESHLNYGGSIRCIAKAPDAEKDLSSSQTANSYIISKDGSYKFKANVAGNGVSSLITDKGNEWDMTGTKWGTGESVSASFTPDKVDYLWYQPALDSSIPSAITTNDICVKILNDGKVDDKGYLHLEVEDWEPGNLIVAAYDKKGTIIWSWHLWLTEKPADMGNGKFALMDRNLGATRKGTKEVTATEAFETYGLFYQWGRKDPSPGAPGVDTGNNSNGSSIWFEYDRVNKNWISQSAVKTCNGPINIKEAAQRPDCFILATTQSDSDSKSPQRWHWMKGYYESNLACKALWGYAVEDGDVGIYPTKTMYDPCPPGYTVAHHWVYWNTLTQKADIKTVTNKDDFMVTDHGYGLTCDKLGSVHFPLSGRRNSQNGNIENVGSTGFFWGSTPKSGGRTLKIGDSWGGLMYTNSTNIDNNQIDHGSDQAYGQSVRCLKQ